MNKNVLTRVLAALGGVTLWAMGLCALAETFFRVPVTAKFGQLLGAGTPLAVLMTLLLAIALCAFGVCCLLMLSQKRAAKRAGFVMQKSENGVIGVSVKSIEGLVQTCVKQHEVIASAAVAVVERRDGIVILLDIQEAAGVNIPLAVGALQKQVKQYVTDCTGVDVQEVRVLVENTESDAPMSPYAVKSPVVMGSVHTPAVMADPVVEQPAYAEEIVEDEIPEAAAEEAAPVVAAPMPVGPAVPPMPEIIPEEDDRPLHQRLFGAEEQPVFVPAPPEMVEVAEEEAEEPTVRTEEEPVQEDPEEPALAEENDPNAVLEVVEAIAQEEMLLDVAEETDDIEAVEITEEAENAEEDELPKEE